MSGCGRLQFVDLPDGAPASDDVSDIDAVACTHTYCATYDDLEVDVQ